MWRFLPTLWGLLALCSCSTFEFPEDTKGMKVTAGPVLGMPTLYDRSNLAGAEDSDGGEVYGVRIAMRRETKLINNLEVGFRLEGLHKHIQFPTAALLGAWEASIAPSLRWNVPLGKDPLLQPFVEGFAGYAYTRNDVTIGNPETHGILLGLAAGAELRLTDAFSLEVSVEHPFIFVSSPKLTEGRAQGFVGLTYRF